MAEEKESLTPGDEKDTCDYPKLCWAEKKKIQDKMIAPDVENQHIKMSFIEEAIQWKEVDSFICMNDHEGLAKLIKEKGISVVWRPSEAPNEATPLHRAAEVGSIACMKVLTEACWSDGISVDSPDCDGNTSLFSAVRATNIESINVLLSMNANVNARNDQGHSILHVIANSISGTTDKEKQGKLLDCLDLILNRPDIDTEVHNNSGFTPLLSAAKKMPSDDGTRRSNSLVLFCRKLTSQGASLDASDKRGITARQALEERSALAAVLMGERRPPPPQRPFISLLLDTLILGDGEQTGELLNGQPQEEANRASNLYLGSQTILFYAVDKCNARAVEALLEAGADSWKEQLSRELCIHRALSRGNFHVLNLLINNMKKKKNVRQLDLTHNSFDLLERLLENQKKKIVSNSEEIDHLKCLQRILQHDIKIDVNEQSERGISQSILHVAASFNNQEAIRLLLEKGAFLGARKNVAGEDRGNILSALRKDTLERAMDECISYQQPPDEIGENHAENLISPDYTLKLNYKFLVPPLENKEDARGINEVETLMDISVHRTHRKAITHPLIQTFLFAKWRKVLPLYAVNLLLYLGFVIFLTFFMYTLKDLRISEEKSLRMNNANLTIEKDIEAYSVKLNIFMAFLIPLALYMLIREVFQIIYTFRTYLKNFENYLEWFLIAIVITLCTANLSVDVTRHLAAWAMIIAWYEFVLLLGRSPPLAIYVTMLRHVSWNFLKLIFLYGALILAFSVSFNIILQPTKVSEEPETAFGNFWSTLPKSIVMATGEFEYSDLSTSFINSRILFATSAVLIFLVFLFLIFLVLMNVMNGLAVTDTQQVMEEATLYSLKSRLELIYLIEEMLLVTPFFNRFLSRIHLISPPKPPHFLVKINYPEKKKRIAYGGGDPEFCKLDNDTAHVLRSYRLQLLSEKEEREKADPVNECLSILQELRNFASQNPGAFSPTTLSPSSSRGRLN